MTIQELTKMQSEEAKKRLAILGVPEDAFNTGSMYTTYKGKNLKGTGIRDIEKFEEFYDFMVYHGIARQNKDGSITNYLFYVGARPENWRKEREELKKHIANVYMIEPHTGFAVGEAETVDFNTYTEVKRNIYDDCNFTIDHPIQKFNDCETVPF